MAPEATMIMHAAMHAAMMRQKSVLKNFLRSSAQILVCFCVISLTLKMNGARDYIPTCSPQLLLGPVVGPVLMAGPILCQSSPRKLRGVALL